MTDGSPDTVLGRIRRVVEDVPPDLDGVVDEQDGRDAVRWEKRGAALGDVFRVLELVQTLDTRREADLVVPLLTLRDADGGETVLVEGVLTVTALPSALLSQVCQVEGAPAPPLRWAAEPRLTPEGREAVRRLSELAEKW